MKSHKQHRLVQPQFAALLVQAQGLRAQSAAENEGWPPAVAGVGHRRGATASTSNHEHGACVDGLVATPRAQLMRPANR